MIFSVSQVNPKAFTVTQVESPLKNIPYSNNMTFRSRSRSGLTLVDDYGNDASILIPVAKFNGIDNTLSIVSTGVTGGTAWDFTIKFKIPDVSANTPIFCCGGYSAAIKGLFLRVNAGVLQVFTCDGLGGVLSSVGASFGFAMTNNTIYTLRIQWNGLTNGTITATLNGVVMQNPESKAWAGAPSEPIVLGKFSTIFGALSIMSIVGSLGGLNVQLYPTGLSTFEFDLSVPFKQFSWNGTAGHYEYEDGDPYFLDHGWTIWKNALNVYQYVPFTLAGARMAVFPSLGGSYAVYSEGLGSVNHNLWDSKVRFSGSFFDRSNTTIWNATARAGYYDASHPKDFHITEINLKTLRSWANDGYGGMFYPKYSNNSIDDRVTMDSLFLYYTDKKDEEIPILTYTNDISRCQRDTDFTYIEDANGYLQLYLYDNLGGDSTYWYSYYQNLLTTNNTVTIGLKPTDCYALSQPLLVPSGGSVIVNCEVRAKTGTIVNLTANVTAGDTVINVSSVAGFAIGEWVSISDNLLPIQVGSTQTRRVASCGRITNIGANTITIHSGSRYNVSSANGGKLGHGQSVIIVNGVDNCSISGSGLVNGNWTNQYDVEPVNTAGAEELLMGCGISLYDTNFSSVSGSLEVINGVLHGVGLKGLYPTSYANNCSITGVIAHHNHDKNIVAFGTTGLVVDDVEVYNAVFEDGLILYASNFTFALSNVYSHNNPRTGVNLNSNGICNGVISNITCDDVLSILSTNVTCNNITIGGTGYIIISAILTAGNNIVFNTVNINDSVSTTMVQILGNINNVVFNDLSIDGCTVTIGGIYITDLSGGGVYPQNIVFNNGGIYNHTGAKFNINPGAGVTFNNFINYP